MSTNFYTHNRKNVAMNVKDLEVGQTLVRIYRPKMHWGTPLGEFKTAEYKVKAILKTRLVLESVEVGEVLGKKHQLRMLLETSKYSTWIAGNVKTDREGDTHSWSREPIELATADDPVIEELREHYTQVKQEHEDRNAAKAAVDEVRQILDGTPNLEKVESAIQALQVIADGLRVRG